MNQKPRRVRWPGHVASNRLPIIIHQDHIARLQHRKMLSQRIRPKVMRVLRVADADVPAHAFGVAFAREDAESEGHVLEHPFAVLSK
jgi:hypothetical protein